MKKLNKSVKRFRLKQLALYGGIVGVVAAVTIPIAVVISHAKRPARTVLYQPSRVLLNEKTLFESGVVKTEAWIPEVIDGNKTGDYIYNPKFKELFSGTPMGIKVNKSTWKVSKELAHTKAFSKVWDVNGLRLFQISQNRGRNLVTAPGPTYIGKKDNKVKAMPYSDDYITDNISKGWTFEQLMTEVSKQISESPHSYVINRGSYALIEPTILGKYTSYGDASNVGSGFGKYEGVALTDVYTSYMQVLSNFVNDNFKYVNNSSPTKNTIVAETVVSSEETMKKLSIKNIRNIISFFKSSAYKKALQLPMTPNPNDQSKTITFSEYLKKATIQNLKWNILRQSVGNSVTRTFPLLTKQDQSKKLEGTKFIKSVSDLYDGFSGFATNPNDGVTVAFIKKTTLKDKIRDLIGVKNNSKTIAHDIDTFDKRQWGNIPSVPIGYKMTFNGTKYEESTEAVSAIRQMTQNFIGPNMTYKFRGDWDRKFVKNTLSGLELGVENYSNPGEKFKIDVVNPTSQPNKFNSFKTAVDIISTTNDLKQLQAWFSGPAEMMPAKLNGGETKPTFTSGGLINGYTLQIPIKFYLGTLFNKMNGKTEAENKDIISQLAYKSYSTLRFNTNKLFVNTPGTPNIKNKNVFTLLTKNNISKIIEKVNSEIFTGGTYSGTPKNTVFGNADQNNFAAHESSVIKNGRWDDKGILDQNANNEAYIYNSNSSPIMRSFSHKLSDLMTLAMYYNAKPEDYLYAQKFSKTLNNYLVNGFDILKTDGTGFTDKLSNVVVEVQEYLNRQSFDVAIGGIVKNDITRDEIGKTIIFHSLKDIKKVTIKDKEIKVFEIPTNFFSTTNFSGTITKLQGKNQAMKTFVTEPVNFGNSSISTVLIDDSKNQIFEIEVFDSTDTKISFNNVSGRPGTGIKHEDSFAEAQFFLKEINGKLYSATFKNTKGIYYA